MNLPVAGIANLIIFIFLKKIKNGNIAGRQQKRIPGLSSYFGGNQGWKIYCDSSTSNLKQQELDE